MTVQHEEDFLPWADEQFRLDPYPWYRRLQAEHPVRYIGGEYVVTRYHDVVRFAKMSCMTVVPGWESAGPWAFLSDTMLGHDAPAHTELRRHTNKWFTPKLVAQWVKATTEVAHEIIDSLGPDGLVEAWRGLAVPATHATMCRVLQVPEDDVDGVVDAMFNAMLMLSSVASDDDVESAATAFNYLKSRMEPMLDAKRANPGDGLADALLAAEARGELTRSQALATAMLFWQIGHMDSGYLVVSGLEIFARKPDVFQAFKTRPEVRMNIVHEMCRIDPPELSMVRYTTEDVEISGVSIPAGSVIRFMIAAANRDPEMFDHPDDFDYERPPEASRNLTFGVGIHGCAGQLITRAEAEAVFAAVADRYDRVELVSEPEVAHNDFARFYKALHLRLS